MIEIPKWIFRMKQFRALVPYAAIILVYAASVLLVNPAGEFPLNDDWSYTRTALSFANGRGMQVDEWSAPSLVGQALYGGLLIRMLGMSFLALRLSTLFAACGTALGLWFVLKRFGVDRRVAWFSVLGWIFNPLQFSLAFTYMTEVPFLFFISLSTVALALYFSKKNASFLVIAAAALGYAFLIRQTALLFLVALGVSLLLDWGMPWKERLRNTVVVAVTAGAFIAAYYLWLEAHGGATPATRRKFDLLQYLTFEQLTGNSFGLLFYVSFLLLPLWALLLPGALRVARNAGKKVVLATLAFWGFLSLTGIWWFYSHYSHRPYLPSKAFHSRMPFLLNVIYDTGLGPITLDPAYFGPSPLPAYPAAWIIMTALAAAATVIPGVLFTLQLNPKKFLSRRDTLVILYLILAFFLIGGFEAVFSHLQEGGLFDRHLLIVAFPLAIAACLMAPKSIHQNGRANRVGLWAGALLLLTLGAFSVAGTRDYLEWNRHRWSLGNAALASGINPLELSAGFEFNAWHNYDVFRARGNVARVFQWWYDKRDYLITMGQMPGFRALREETFYSWVHRRTVTMYLLKREEI
jgi:4-amino-4-deoxy-L-arabinose transferase-like glycosyltransferase